jgi:ribosomal protein S18 acetylase RimI-like enzyme
MQYFKRYRMVCDLAQIVVDRVELPPGYVAVPWSEGLLERHANVKFHSFRNEIDSGVFPCLGDLYGCIRLMQEISTQGGFCPSATWLIVRENGTELQDCGTIQGLQTSGGLGSIQNVGVIPDSRQLGLGKALVKLAIGHFQELGLKEATLEVTASNQAALMLYHRLGFRIVRTMYRSVPQNEALF